MLEVVEPFHVPVPVTVPDNCVVVEPSDTIAPVLNTKFPISIFVVMVGWFVTQVPVDNITLSVLAGAVVDTVKALPPNVYQLPAVDHVVEDDPDHTLSPVASVTSLKSIVLTVFVTTELVLSHPPEVTLRLNQVVCVKVPGE